jgi:glycosyltransferase involved in cell wall biosynthesis
MKVLFVGSFENAAKDGGVGGQMFASKSLLHSKLNERIDWVTIDSTADSNLEIPMYKRVHKALKRILRFSFHIVFSKVKMVLIFTSSGLSFGEKGLMVILATALGKKTILAPRSGFVVKDMEKGGLLSKFIPFVVKRANVVVCQGATWKSFYEKMDQGKGEKFLVIQNWIDTSAIQPAPITDDKIDILFLAWVDVQKGIFDLLEAVAEIKTQKQIHLHVAGGGTALDKSIELVELLGIKNITTFHGWVVGEKKKELLNLADIFILPSYAEGFPNSLMEAMAYGKAVISTKVGSIPDLVEHKRNGWLVNAGNKKEIQTAIEALINDDKLRWHLGEEAKKSVEVNNSIDSAITKFQNIFELD